MSDRTEAAWYGESGANRRGGGGAEYRPEPGGPGGEEYGYGPQDAVGPGGYEPGQGPTDAGGRGGEEYGYGPQDGGGDESAGRRGAGVLPPGYVDHEPPPDRPARRRAHRGERRRHRVLFTVAALVVVLLLIVGGGLIWVQSQVNPGGHHGPAVAVSIPKGATTKDIGKILAHDGVIHQGTLFALYVRFHDDGPLLPGLYHLPHNSSYQTAISALEAGPPVSTARLVVPEGFTLHQIADAVAALPGMRLSAQKFLAAADNGTVRSPYEPKGVNNLEGLLFPATYQVQQGESEVQILEQMVGAFDDQANSLDLTAAAQGHHETVYQLVTVASIVEREAKLDADRGPVASVLYNRLAAGMPLGADSTQTYYLRLSHPNLEPTATQLNQPGPYNTRLNTGLPPTPIANPGLPSLRAAASPPSTTYLYFVEVKPDGQLGFASTSNGFTQLQAECRAASLC